MTGVGPIELVIIVIIVVALFGPTLIAFWLGFTLGRRSSTPAEKDRAADGPAAAAAPAAPGQRSAPTADDTPASPEEPSDE